MPPHKILARRAAREAVVLLKNGAAADRPLLPAAAVSLKTIAVVGPSADSPSAYIGKCPSNLACE